VKVVNACHATAIGEMMNFGEYCRQQITKEGKTITWLANQIGAHPSLIVKWRTRGSNPKTDYFLRICIVLATLQGRPINGIIQEAAEAMGIEIKIT
jgi:hypothetical protein